MRTSLGGSNGERDRPSLLLGQHELVISGGQWILGICGEMDVL